MVVVVGGGRGLASFPGPRFIQLHEGKKRGLGMRLVRPDQFCRYPTSSLQPALGPTILKLAACTSDRSQTQKSLDLPRFSSLDGCSRCIPNKYSE